MRWGKAEEIEAVVRSKVAPDSKLYAPLHILAAEFEPGTGIRSDIDLVLGYKNRRYRFAVEIKARTAPSVVRDAIRILHEFPRRPDIYPMLLVPYLSETVVRMLEDADISGIDPNGNFFIQRPDILAIRLDRKNEYTESAGIKKIYSRNSSIVGRFLLREHREFTSVTEIHEGIGSHGGGISLSTVSKVLTALEEDLIIEKCARVIRVLQADELLERLVEGYRAPRVREVLKLKIPGVQVQEKSHILDSQLGRYAWVWDGATSAERFTMTTPSRVHTAFTRSDLRALDRLRTYEDDRFYNCVVNRTTDSFVYFDSGVTWCSPIECYLAMMQLDKRERELVQPLREEILSPFLRAIN